MLDEEEIIERINAMPIEELVEKFKQTLEESYIPYTIEEGGKILFAGIFEDNLDETRPQAAKRKKNMQTFMHPIFGKTRILNQDGVIWIAGVDAARALGYRNGVSVIKDHVAPKDKGLLYLHEADDKTIHQMELTLLNEDGLGSLVKVSCSLQAGDYYKWIMGDIKPKLLTEKSYCGKKKLLWGKMQDDENIKWEKVGERMVIYPDNALEQYEALGYPHRWEITLRCGECKKVTAVDSSIAYKFCPHCGAKMA